MTPFLKERNLIHALKSIFFFFPCDFRRTEKKKQKLSGETFFITYKINTVKTYCK